jgi:hypothetical protein
LFFTDLDGNGTDTIFYHADLRYIEPSYVDTILVGVGHRFLYTKSGYDSIVGAVYWISQSGLITDTLFVPNIGYIQSIIHLPDSTYLLSGIGNPKWTGKADGKYRYAKISRTGEIIWTKEYLPFDPSYPDPAIKPFFLLHEVDATLVHDTTIIVQYTANFLEHPKFGFLTLDLDGNVLSDKIYNYYRQIAGDDGVFHKVRTRKSGNLVSNAMFSHPSDPAGMIGGAAPIAGLDENLTTDWIYINEFQAQDPIKHHIPAWRIYDLLVRKDGNIVAVGIMSDTLFTSGAWNGAGIDSIELRETPVLLVFDDNGKLLTQKYIDPELMWQGWIYGIAETADGGVILVGEQEVPLPEYSYGAPFALKLDKDYCYEVGCRDSSVLFKPMFQAPIDEIEIKPNPAKGKFQVLLTAQNLAERPVLRMYSASWQLMKEEKLVQPETEIQIQLMPVGSYMVTIANQDGKLIKSQKLVNLGP